MDGEYTQGEAKSSLTVEVYRDREGWLRGDPAIGPGRSASFGSSLAADLLGARSRSRNVGLVNIWAHFNPEVWRRLGFRPELDPSGKTKAGINMDARRGMEPYIGAALAKKKQLAVVDPGDYTIVRSPDWPLLHQSPDVLVLREGGAAKPGGYYTTGSVEELAAMVRGGMVRTFGELKTIHPFYIQGWAEGEPDLPTIIQCHHGMLITGFREAYVAAFIGYGDDEDTDQLCFAVPWEEDLGNLLQETVFKMQRWIEMDQEPPADGMESTTRMLNLLFPARPSEKHAVTITLGAQHVKTHLNIAKVKKALDNLEREEERLKQVIISEMGNAGADEAIVPVDPEALPEGAKYVRNAYVQGDRTCDCGKCIQKGGPRTSLRVAKMGTKRKKKASKKKGGE